MTLNSLSIVTVCMNRREHLQATARKVAEWPHHHEHLILDWSSAEPLRRHELPDDPRLRAGNILYTLGFIALLAWAASVATDWPLRSALIIYSLAGVGIPLALLQVALDLLGIRGHRRLGASPGATPAGPPDALSDSIRPPPE